MMAEHGFIGLGLFCCLILAIYRSCSVVQKRVHGRADLAWAADLACTTQIALVAFLAGGSFVSIASNPSLYLLAGIAVGTRSLIGRELTASRSRTGRGPIRMAARTIAQRAA
jgi:putative inorganic carbon (HCO3(-)) transporter